MNIGGGSVGEFFDRYNEKLDALGCGVRVAASATGDVGLMTIVDIDGKTIADLPTSIEPPALDAVMTLVEKSFEEGVQTGRALEQSSD